MRFEADLLMEFARNTYGGLYIVLEGIDGSGKTIHAGKLKEHFEQLGKKVVVTHEPRKTSALLSEVTKNILQGNVNIPPAAFQYLFTAERIMHHQELIIPALKMGDVVISDRSFWSAIPYGLMDLDSQDMKKQAKEILAAHGMPFVTGQTIMPDVTFYLEIDVDIAMKRLTTKKGVKKEIYEKKNSLEKAKKGYDWLLKTFSKEFVTIDTNRDVDEVTQDMVEYLKNLK